MKKGFTLGEILIALVIVGIIASIMTPVLVNNFTSKSQVAALQSTYTAISNAVRLMLIDERASSIFKSSLYMESSENVTETAGAFLKKYFKVTTDCETEPGECFAAAYKNLNAEDITLPKKGNAYCVGTSTGASICIEPPAAATKHVARVLTDINGPKQPNIAGRDLFLFYIYMDGFIGDRVSSTDNLSTCTGNTYGSGCFNRIINADWVMDY